MDRSARIKTKMASKGAPVHRALKGGVSARPRAEGAFWRGMCMPMLEGRQPPWDLAGRSFPGIFIISTQHGWL